MHKTLPIGQLFARSGLLGCLLLGAAACQSSDPHASLAPVDRRSEAVGLIDQAFLRGEVTYRPKIALPPRSIINIQLLDVSIADAPSTTLGKQTFVTSGQNVPLPFSLTYDRGVIKPNHTYAISATITVSGQVLFRTTSQQRVLTGDAPRNDVTILVEPVGG